MSRKIGSMMLQLFAFASALLSVACYNSIVCAADYLISTQSDFDTYRQATFAPGDNILFERGKVFNGMFAPTTVGTPGNMITISTYGSGAKPIINNNGVLHSHPTRVGETVSAGLLLFNPEYVEVNNLEITNNNGGNQDGDALFGIYVLAEDTGKYHNSVYIKDNYVHHVNGAVAGKHRGGIHVHGYSPTSSNTASYNDLRIENNIIDQIGGVGIGTDIDDLVDAHDFVGTNRPNAITNLYVGHNWIGNTGRNTVIARDSDYAVYEYNTSANSSRYDTGHSFFNFRTLGLTFQHNEAYGNVGADGDSDRGGFDADYNSRDTLIQYNYSHDNHWFAGIMKRPNADVTIRYNLSVNDRKGAYFYGFENESDLSNLHIYNNTHYFNSSISPEIITRDRTPHETTFNNNIFYAAGSGTMGSDAENGINVAYDTNVYFNIIPPTSELHAFTADPLFVSPGTEPYDVDMELGKDVLAGYRLQSNSPYLDAGLTIANNGGLDFWGAPVPLGATDIGASESIGTGTNPMATIVFGDVFPESSSAEVIAATPDDGVFGQDAPTSLTQTFKVDSDFDLKSIFLDYEFDPLANPNNINIDLEIFEVADVSADTITPGTTLLSLTNLSMPELVAGEEAAIILSTPITLLSTTGATGYGLRVSGGGDPGFEWRRTGSTLGSVYPDGQAYEDGVEKNGGERDFVLALSSADPIGSADFDGNGVVDGLDFLKWQRGESTDPFSAADLTLWESQYNSASSSTATASVPEPSNYLLVIISVCLATCRWQHIILRV